MSVDNVYIEVANGDSITLPGLSEEERVIGETPETRRFIRQIIHHPDFIGWPSIEEFGKTGVLIQPLDDQTARALLVIDEEDSKRYLAMLKFAYEHIGYTLFIDHTTVFRQPWLRPDTGEDDAPAVSQMSSMEVA
jgi:hypothetical protein